MSSLSFATPAPARSISPAQTGAAAARKAAPDAPAFVLPELDASVVATSGRARVDEMPGRPQPRDRNERAASRPDRRDDDTQPAAASERPGREEAAPAEAPRSDTPSHADATKNTDEAVESDPESKDEARSADEALAQPTITADQAVPPTPAPAIPSAGQIELTASGLGIEAVGFGARKAPGVPATPGGDAQNSDQTESATAARNGPVVTATPGGAAGTADPTGNAAALQNSAPESAGAESAIGPAGDGKAQQLGAQSRASVASGLSLPSPGMGLAAEQLAESGLAQAALPKTQQRGAGEGQQGASPSDQGTAAPTDAVAATPAASSEQGSHAGSSGQQGAGGERGAAMLPDAATPASQAAPPSAERGPGESFAFQLSTSPTAGTVSAPAATSDSAAIPVVAGVPIGKVPIEIGLKSLEGVNRFDIRLTPDELGRVEVRLEIDATGQVKAHLVVERPETLAFLTRDRGQLERAFEQAGLKAADGSVSFSLRDGGQDGGNGRNMSGGDQPPSRAPRTPTSDDTTLPSVAAPVAARALGGRVGGLDLTI